VASAAPVLAGRRARCFRASPGCSAGRRATPAGRLPPRRGRWSSVRRWRSVSPGRGTTDRHVGVTAIITRLLLSRLGLW